MNDKCWICRRTVEPYSWNYSQPGAHIKCPICGEHRLSERLANKLGLYPLDNSYVFSAAIREQNEKGLVPWVEDLEELKSSVAIPHGPLEAIDRILLHIYKKMSSASEFLEINPETDFPLGYAHDASEFEFLIQKALELFYLEEGPFQQQYRLALNGWRRIDHLRQNEVKSNQAFVAMWFNNDLDDAWLNGIKPALEQTGYAPLRIDLKQHNEKIDDQIIAEIRKSGLLVADFTGQRGGVYFEAGFAMGLGIPVIWTCREEDVAKLHFDTRQYNHIVWNDAADLREKLIARIEATLPNRVSRSR